MPNQDNNQTSNPNDQTVTPKTDDQKPVVSFPEVENVLPPMPQQAEIGNEKLEVSETQKTDAVDTTPATITTNTGSAAPSDDVIMPSIVGTVPPPQKKFVGGKVIATILGLFLLVGGVGAGVFLTGENQNPQEKAGTECPQGANYCMNERCESMKWCKNAGCSAEYTSDCEGGNIDLIARCDNVKAYSASWVLLSQSDLSNLKAGDQVNFCATGFSNVKLPFTAARFTINGSLRPETTATRPGGVPNEFCDLYTIPANVTTFNVSAEVKRMNRWR